MVGAVPDQLSAPGIDSAPAGAVSTARISLPILSTAKAGQGANGLKHGDFTRYRQYCTRRLERVRRGAAVTQGRGRFVARPVTAADARRDDRALLVPLLLSERAWAAAKETQKEVQASESGVGGTVNNPAKARRRVVLKLRRAVQAAEKLRELCVEVGDERTVFEAEAYAKWMAATLDLECEEWAKALSGFEIVGRVYTLIIAMCEGSAASGVFEERCEEVENYVRLCRYNLARSGQRGDMDEEELLRGIRESGAAGGDDVLAAKIDSVLVDARRRAAQNLGHVDWCASEVPLRSETVREAVLAAQEKSKELRADNTLFNSVDAYDDVFIVYNDAIQTVKKELSEFREAGTSRADERAAELDRLVAYLSHGRIMHTIDRNLLLIESLKAKTSSKPDDFVRLYDNLIQNLTDILGLSGVEEDVAFSNQIEARRLVYRAHRCFHLAECYRVAEMLPQAAALYDRVAEMARSLAGSHAADAGEIVARSRGMKCRVRANEFIKHAVVASELSALSVHAKDEKSKTAPAGVHAVMVDHLDAFVSFAGDTSGARSIIDIPPALEAVPCKPVLFDLAIDGIKFPEPPAVNPGQDKEAAVSNGSNTASSTLFSRWFSSSTK